MPESSHEVKITPSGSFECRMSPLREFGQSQALSLTVHRNPCMQATFCTEVNVPECLSYINQEVSSLGLPPVWSQLAGGSELNAVAALNSMYDLIQLHRRDLRTLEDMEVEQLKSSSNVEFLQLSNSRLKDQLEVSKRENTVLNERQRQLQLKVKSLQNCLKNEKEEVQKLQNIIASRASQYNHDMKRKEREFNKLKERLNQLLVDKKEKKQAIEVLNYIGRADGKRSLWKTGKTEAKHEGEMYKTLLSDYDNRQKELLVENAELSKVLQQMKRDMVSILSSKKPTLEGKKHDDGPVQADSEEDEEVFDCGKESVELSCMLAREKLTNSIRLQWRRLKSHVERLDSQASNVDAIPREAHEQEMDRLKLEIQQCKDFIHTQQQLLQQQLSSPCDEEMASLLNDCYMLEEKERLKEEWRTLEEQRKNFEKERRNFTEAAIRLSHERKAFEEDRATWLKHQFLNLTPFADSKKPPLSKSKSAFSISESEAGETSSPEKSNKHKPEPHTTFSTPRFPAVKMSSTADLHRAIHLIPENSPSMMSKPKRRSSCTQESRLFPSSDVPVQLHQGNGEHHRSHTPHGEEENSSV
ncbi:afadin- and alpha-actinin-binding protein-like [Lampris incognitus]|uniref:afadin- and alpha-actinin-binding protein-like n=1 Tax=Lampris incognitus TaxID=2546036 RepID=UPI0024B61570|nr:afadin- and alpha-actinin-binding protein-like [Lampris incognitus]